ncbi:MAG: UDP-N-acetylmuramoyl-tripeptide--D-alanyl-D-alanine ligase [Desulfonauticus sp.]|jgi:UDP-N-acetylmuramoyl-tripeptide--D-alanyl-D-alanine ligase|nr:UDP-N-acetylmuramoyl-tripeptide--D-alanyl-D-alanine ligase [Desulfonauticus sp.]
MKLRLKDIYLITRAIGELKGQEDKAIKGIKIDSRLVEEGDIFFCIRGNRFDGHSFAQEAEKKGALALVVHRPLEYEPHIPVLLVDDTIKALGRVANFLRKNSKAKVVAFTGSAGKTTTKEIAYFLLKQRHKVERNFKNWNNQIGIPLSIFNFSGEEDIWLLEVGINNTYDMDELGEIVTPDVAVILNVGPCHLEGLKNVKEVAKNKMKLLQFLTSSGISFINDKYLELVEEAKNYPRVNKIYFKQEDSIQVKFKGISKDKKGLFIITWIGEEFEVELPFWGIQFEDNLKCALLLSKYFSLTKEEVIQGLKTIELPQHRFNFFQQGVFGVIDDSYNANPLSMRASLYSAKTIANELPLILVLGDMAELGAATEEEHLNLGKLLREINPYLIFYKGKNYRFVAQGYGKEDSILEVNNEDEFISYIKNYNLKKGLFLFKASRSIGLDNFVNKFKREF